MNVRLFLGSVDWLQTGNISVSVYSGRTQDPEIIYPSSDIFFTSYSMKQYLYIRVQWFFKLTMLHVVFDRQEISKTILEKAFFFIVWRFYLFSVFV
jgi:hypothetical protein